MIVRDGLDEAMNYWRGFEYIRNKSIEENLGKISDSNITHQDKFQGQCLDSKSLISAFIVREKIKQYDIYTNILNWQFMSLNPYLMGTTKPRKRTSKYINLKNMVYPRVILIETTQKKLLKT